MHSLKFIFIALIFFSCGQAQTIDIENNVEENMNSDIDVENNKDTEDTEIDTLLISDNFKLFYEGLEVSKVQFCVKTVSHSQKKPSLFTASCVIEPLTNER